MCLSVQQCPTPPASASHAGKSWPVNWKEYEGSVNGLKPINATCGDRVVFTWSHRRRRSLMQMNMNDDMHDIYMDNAGGCPAAEMKIMRPTVRWPSAAVLPMPRLHTMLLACHSMHVAASTHAWPGMLT